LHADVRGRRIVVVGGGVAGCEKVRRLVAAGAVVTVVDPSPAPELESLDVRLDRREFQDNDVVGAWLVIVATGDEAVDDKVERAATEAGVWVNRADKPDGGGIAFAAVIERGPVTVGVSTGGSSPTLARWVRDRIDAALPIEVGALAALLSGRPRTAGRRRHRGLPLDEALGALMAGAPERAARLLEVEVSSE
jgi:siroheme synthase-like protein